MSWDWTKEELLQELKEREADGESREMIHDFIWSVIERAYQERDNLRSETNKGAEIKSLFGRGSWHVMQESPFTLEEIEKRRWSGSEEK